MTNITLDDMSSKLLTVDAVFDRLSTTEPLTVDHVASTNKVKFHLEPDWATGIDALDGTDNVGMTMTIDGAERQVTKEAALQAGAIFGLPAAYAKKIPAIHVERLLNYHWGSGYGESEYKVLSVKNSVSAFMKPTLVPFSNIQLLENALEGIRGRLGADAPVYADYKINNSLQHTDVRLITPGVSRTMVDTNMSDVPGGQTDEWFAGLHLSNSLIAKKQTTLEAYLFRWWCTNGCTTVLDDIGTWSRKSDGQNEDVYEWARSTVDEVLGGLEGRFDEVQALARLNVAGNTADVLREIFSEFEVPVSQRDDIMAQMLETETLTMYGIMNSITQVANDVELDPRRADRLMRIGGAIPTRTFDTLKARIFREGQSNPTGPNPYEILA